MKSTNNDLRLLFERTYGKRISDATWYRTKNLFNSEFPLNKTNIIWLAEVKKQLPRCEINLACLLQAVNNTQRMLVSQHTISGEQLLQYFSQWNINVHPNTLTNWFKPIYGFRKTRIYSAKELKPVVMAAFAYKLRKDSVTNVNSLIQLGA